MWIFFLDSARAKWDRISGPTARGVAAVDLKLVPIAERALKEANPEYPVPRLMSRRKCEALVRKMFCQ